ncbi:MAG: ABC-F family ATP-binding cassette domain-containing protein [Acetatifactor sp.]
MNILTVDNITKSYGERKLFHNASFFLEEGEKAGIIGINGTGKSTLLKMIAGVEEPDEGRIITANHCVVRFLPQNPQFAEEETVLEAVTKGNLTEVNESFPEADAKAMLTRLGVTDFAEKVGHLSGGQKKRLALVSVLLSPAEILVLDEPTNHLDNEMSDWLEETLKKRKGAVIMVTHDRYFLDSVTTRIIEIDKGSIYSYAANYEGYLSLKMQREEMELASQRKRESILRNELAWVQRGARARSTKQKARLERYEEMKDIKGPVQDGRVEMASASTRLGRTTVELTSVSKSYGNNLLIDDFTYLFGKDDRVGFIGPNGSGKSTLMKLITGEVLPDSGTIELGQTVKIGYYAQEISTEEMNPRQRVIDYIRDVAEFVDTDEGKVSAARMLERFLFAGEDQYGLLGKLSGGERRRLYFLKVLMGAPNVLILDEPTNDLDIATLRILEDYLDSFHGIVIVVSHDRYFLDRTVRRIFALEEGGKLVQYEGGYTDYANRKKWENEEKAPSGAAKQGKSSGGMANKNNSIVDTAKDWKAGRKKKLKFTYQEQKDYETIESDIASLEEKIVQCETDSLQCAHDFVKLGEIAKEKEAAEKQLEEKMERWMYLEDLAARIENGEEV